MPVIGNFFLKNGPMGTVDSVPQLQHHTGPDRRMDRLADALVKKWFECDDQVLVQTIGHFIDNVVKLK